MRAQQPARSVPGDVPVLQYMDRGAAVVLSELFPPIVGGSAELLVNVYGRLRQVPVTVLTGGSSTRPTEELLSGLRVIRSLPWAPHWGVMNPAGLSLHLRRAFRLRRLSPRGAVVHCGRVLPEGFDAYLSQWLGGAPYVCWAHGEEIVYAEHSREMRALMQQAYGHAAGVIANSQSTKTKLIEFGVAPARIVIAYPGVDTDRFRPDVPGAAALRARLTRPGEILMLTIGRLQKRKGHDLVLRALASLDADAPRVRYVVVGAGLEEAHLRRMTAELGVTAQVEFVGEAPAADLPAYYAAADVFVHPNRVEQGDFEGFGIVFLEAAAAGLPVVAGATGGAPEAVADGITGVLVSGTDVAELRAVLLALMASPARRSAMGAAGRARAIDRFSWDRAASIVETLHNGVAERDSRAPAKAQLLSDID